MQVVSDLLPLVFGLPGVPGLTAQSPAEAALLIDTESVVVMALVHSPSLVMEPTKILHSGYSAISNLVQSPLPHAHGQCGLIGLLVPLVVVAERIIAFGTVNVAQF